jgi:hypothetical protein
MANDADIRALTRRVHELDNTLKNLVKVLATMNQNTVQIFQKLTEEGQDAQSERS